jgi:hypothetical protein
MISAHDIARLAGACAQIADECADASGFVPVRSLLRRFDADLVVRPLLVEAMLATRDGRDGRPPWVLLIDADRYPVRWEDVVAEEADSALDVRFRNTVAHELAHSLAFRPKEFGVRLSLPTSDGPLDSASIAAVEAATERISPLLLAPEQTIQAHVAGMCGPMHVDEVLRLQARLGVSRYVLVRRLTLLPMSDSAAVRLRPGLADVLVGVGKWTPAGPVLMKWPLFGNFKRNVYPGPIHDLLRDRVDQLPIEDLIHGSSDTLPSPQSPGKIVATNDMRQVAPNRHVTVTLETEHVDRRNGAEFLVVLRREESDLGTRVQ